MLETYNNSRLDPKNFLDGPLSPNPATRLRQMLARPGTIVRQSSFRWFADADIDRISSWLLAFTMGSVLDAPWRLDSRACTKGQLYPFDPGSTMSSFTSSQWRSNHRLKARPTRSSHGDFE